MARRSISDYLASMFGKDQQSPQRGHGPVEYPEDPSFDPAKFPGGAPIDLARSIVHNPDGSFSTERTITVSDGGKQIVLPTIVDGRERSEEEATSLWRAGKNKEVGTFTDPQQAEYYAQQRSAAIARAREKEAGDQEQQPSLNGSELGPNNYVLPAMKFNIQTPYTLPPQKFNVYGGTAGLPDLPPDPTLPGLPPDPDAVALLDPYRGAPAMRGQGALPQQIAPAFSDLGPALRGRRR